MKSPEANGLLGHGYAEARAKPGQLRFRLRTRAMIAVEAYRERCGETSRPRVLDLGAAEGATLVELRALLGGDGAYDGVELAAELIERAPRLPDNTRLLHGDVTDLPAELEPGTYDLCTVLAVLEHLREPAACLRGAFRMLRPGGVLVATCPNPIWDDIAGRLRLVADEHHAQSLRGEDMVRLAEAAGFERTEHRPFMFAPVGLLPYLRVPLSPRAALRIDDALRRIRLMRFGFVNQLLIAQRPAHAQDLP